MPSSLVGTKLIKNNLNPREYIDLVVTCNKSGSCHIEDKGSYYEVPCVFTFGEVQPISSLFFVFSGH